MDMLRSHRTTEEISVAEQQKRFKHLYDISGLFDPPSIKDQVIRASNFIESAVKQKIISLDIPFLVIGAGFTGMTAAMRSAVYGIPTYVVEIQEEIFPNFTTIQRFVCPNQYDFPHEHWKENEFPWAESRFIPVTWKTDKASKIVGRFDDEVGRIQKKYPLYIAKQTTCKINYKSNDDLVSVEFVSNDKDSVVGFDNNHLSEHIPSEFGMVLSCLGLGTEKTTLASYTGQKFWNFRADRQRELDNKEILICGAGDGGLQDFLLLATGKKLAKEVYFDIIELLSENIKNEIELEILRIQDNAVRLHKFCEYMGATEKCRIENETHEKIKSVVEKIFSNDDFVSKAGNLYLETTNAFKENKITLAYRCTHFTKCYSLNQFLVLFLDKLQRFITEGDKTFLLENTEIESIKGIYPHTCRNNFVECYNKEHQVERKYAACIGSVDDKEVTGKSQITADEDKKIENPHLIVLRFGINRNETIKKVLNLHGALPLEQGIEMLPFNLP